MKRMLKIIISIAVLAVCMFNLVAKEATEDRCQLSKTTVSVTDFGARPDDKTDDTKAINEALNSGCNVVFPPGVYHITSTIRISNPMSKNKTICAKGTNTVEIESLNSALFLIDYFKEIKNLTFNNVAVEIYGGDERNNSRYFTSNTFKGLPRNVPCMNLVGNFGPIANIHIHNNRFLSGRHTVFGEIKNSTIQSNYSENCKRNYEFHAFCENTIIKNNELHGGVVGIGFFCLKGAGNSMFGNIVENNKLFDQSEEGISFDMFGNEERSYSRWNGIVESYTTNGNKVGRLYFNEAPGNVEQHRLVFIGDGEKIKGYNTSITKTGIENGKFYVDLSYGPNKELMYDNPLVVILSFVADQNIIRYNTIERTGRTGIVLHGSGFNTLIEYNTLKDCNHEMPQKQKFWGGISVRNIHIYSTPGHHGPVYFNTVRYNSVSGEKCTINAYDPWTSKTPKSIGNVFYGNSFADRAILDTLSGINVPYVLPHPKLEIDMGKDTIRLTDGNTLMLKVKCENFATDSMAFHLNGEHIGTDTIAPFEFPLSNLADEESIIHAIGFGSAGDQRLMDYLTIVKE